MIAEVWQVAWVSFAATIGALAALAVGFLVFSAGRWIGEQMACPYPINGKKTKAGCVAAGQCGCGARHNG